MITVDSNPMITTRIMEVRTGAYYLIGKTPIPSSTDILIVMVPIKYTASGILNDSLPTFRGLREVLKRNIFIFAKLCLRIGKLSQKGERGLF